MQRQSPGTDIRLLSHSHHNYSVNTTLSQALLLGRQSPFLMEHILAKKTDKETNK